MASALAHCHTQRPPLVHRDLSAKNVLLGLADGRARVADFGLCAAKRHTFLSDDRRGVLGTAAYAAPELMQGGQITERCDVYSYGVLVWEVRCAGVRIIAAVPPPSPSDIALPHPCSCEHVPLPPCSY